MVKENIGASGIGEEMTEIDKILKCLIQLIEYIDEALKEDENYVFHREKRIVDNGFVDNGNKICNLVISLKGNDSNGVN